MVSLGDHRIIQEGQAIRYSRRRDEYHDASRHPLGDVHTVKPPRDKEGGDKEYDGGYDEAGHTASISKIGDRASGSRRMPRSAHRKHWSGRYILEQLITAVTPAVC